MIESDLEALEGMKDRKYS